MKKSQIKFMYYGYEVHFNFKKSKRRIVRNNKPKLFKYSTKYY